tara:strand:+ start:3630 stop:4667 length:1038 start_codon:yes stop_codon:yes gene_type:complete
MKIALITDTHYNFKKANKNFHEYFEKFYEDIFFPYLERNKITNCIHLGDAFDNRKGVDYWALDWAKKHVYDKFLELGVSVYSICGNHDTYYKNTNSVNSIDILLNEYFNVIKITSPKEIQVGDAEFVMLPWINASNQEETFELLEKSRLKFVCGHLELSGFPVFPGQDQPHGMDKGIFSKFTRVFSGHYHTRSNDGKIFYLGNPYQMFWNDWNDVRGFNVFDTETLQLEHIENPYTIFEKIYYDDYTQSTEFDIEDKFVKLIVKSKKNQKNYDKFLDNIMSMKPLDVKISEILDIDDTNYQYQESDVEDTLTTLNSYIEESEFDLDKSIAKKIIKDVYLEAMEIE